MKPRKQKTMGAILQDANESIQGNIKGGYYWGEHIYRVLSNMWKTAYVRGYDKALRDQAKDDAIMHKRREYVRSILASKEKDQPSDALTTLLQDVNGVSDADAAADFEIVGNQVAAERRQA